MKKVLVLITLVVASCNSKDSQFCECLSKGEELNNYTQQFFDKSPSPEEREKLKGLKQAKTEACKDYQTMSGEEMRVKKEACSN